MNCTSPLPTFLAVSGRDKAYQCRPLQQRYEDVEGADLSKGGLKECDADRQAGEEGDEEQKRMARMQRNRESAMLSRQRKKMQLDELEQQNKQLQATNTHLSGAL